jgi:uncharacterized protein (TIGR02996 family)
MTDDEAFLAAIREDPLTEGPRLIYADWLDEHGRPLEAEFLRVQCELQRLRATPASPWRDLRLLQVKQRERELLISLWGATAPQGPESDTRGHLLPLVVTEVVARATLLLGKDLPLPVDRQRSLFDDVEAS